MPYNATAQFYGALVQAADKAASGTAHDLHIMSEVLRQILGTPAVLTTVASEQVWDALTVAQWASTLVATIGLGVDTKNAIVCNLILTHLAAALTLE